MLPPANRRPESRVARSGTGQKTPPILSVMVSRFCGDASDYGHGHGHGDGSRILGGPPMRVSIPNNANQQRRSVAVAVAVAVAVPVPRFIM